MDALWDEEWAGQVVPGPGGGEIGQVLFSGIDLHFAKLMDKLAARGCTGVREASALVSSFTRQGHSCIDLKAHAGRTLGGSMACPELTEWLRSLEASGVVGRPGEYKPMVLDRTRLYLWRYWNYQWVLARALKSLAARSTACDPEVIGARLGRSFPETREEDGIDWQKVAVVVALKGALGIITGGPGTGKTTVVSKILDLLSEDGPGLKVALAAPTGKAAQRMEEAVSRAGAVSGPGGLLSASLRASTIHRLLGMVPGRARARFSDVNPLPYDVVVVDEASMISLALMARLVLALKPGARLILVGDRNQLASVEPGHVLGDICGAAPGPCYSRETAETVLRTTGYSLPIGTPRGLDDCLVELKTTYRFRGDSGIRALGEAVRAGDARACLDLVAKGAMTDVVVRDPRGTEAFPRAIVPAVLKGYAPCLGEASLEERFRLFGRFRVLCALREGPYGVSALNRLIERILEDKGLLRPGGLHYHGRPVLITANDYTIKLFNGDIGIELFDEGELRCFFPGPGGALRRVSVSRLPEHETAFAMTVHKSQGSEFSNVMLVLPPKDSPVLTRELIYTGITRAMEGLEIWTTPEVFSTAVTRRSERISGLNDLLRAED
ncbi:MAG TPA: exodeoxyribonuclease V subunit alpha [Deltaproteobacteria bacterium]|jgi:exodeoxyribonuclease V alpha subunit|nr:exodeoxyribonuclease V subunit alpha [Deltaproteobacteria bacterium]HOI07537.1 exodeoxyribonuclease V subunit alpha [Deltaproteobacteria bacterium]